jgi:peroxiredoxin
MKRLHSICCLLVSFFLLSNIFVRANDNEILIKIYRNPGRDTAQISWYTLSYVGYEPDWKSRTIKIDNEGYSEIKLQSDKIIVLSSRTLFGRYYLPFLSEPGDRVSVTFFNGSLHFDGTGKEKYQVMCEIDSVWSSLSGPKPKTNFESMTAEAFQLWNHYLNNKLYVIDSILKTKKTLLSGLAYDYIKSYFLSANEVIRANNFYYLYLASEKLELTRESLVNIYDNTMNNNYVNWLTEGENMLSGIMFFHAWTRNQVFRKFKFDSNQDSLVDDSKRKWLYYYHAKTTLKGITRERYLVYLITYNTIKEVGFTQETEKILNDYHNSIKHQEYKTFVSAFEQKYRVLKQGRPAPAFLLPNSKGELISSEGFTGKIVLMDFWFTGCVGCMQMTPAIREIEKAFERDTMVKFLSISTDSDSGKWLKSVREKKFTTGNGVNLYAGSGSGNHEMTKSYGVISYPTLYLMDTEGKIVQNPLPDPRYDNGIEIIRLIKLKLSALSDGPYLQRQGQKIEGYVIKGDKVHKSRFEKGRSNFLVQYSSDGKTFPVTLKNPIVEPAEFEKPAKFLVLSDIEGNFEALRDILENNGVIDPDFNWTFGKGHLVLNGDIFDRGEQVTECLWLIYSLEQKAKIHGGYVHFILGNHEIMNLNGDHRYIQYKYKKNAARLGKTYQELFGKESVLGNWIRTKNIIEKIGSLLFVHGGISDSLIDYNMTVKAINDKARPFLANEVTAKTSRDRVLRILFDSKNSPFWHRLFYQDSEIKVYSNGNTIQKTSMQQVKNALLHFEVDHIITGHTIVGDTISVHYDGKVINTDTPHSEGKSEALLILGKSFYRVNKYGVRTLLFDEPAIDAQLTTK